MADYPPGARPVTVLLFSDVHVHGPDMPPSRLARIVKQIDALHPDVVIAAGDFMGDEALGASYPVGEALAPLRGLHAPLGVYAVLGNKDYKLGGDRVRRALGVAGVRVLANDAARAGPLAIGGIDGAISIPKGEWRGRRARTYAALDATPGAKLLVAHRPDEFRFAPAFVDLVLAGHTHCGQVVLPVLGPLETGSDFGREYLCGLIREHGRTLVVTAGVGTSRIPMRIGAPPDMWLISISGKRTARPN